MVVLSRVRRIYGVVALICLFPEICLAAAWTLKPGQWEIYREITYYSTDEFWDNRGQSLPQDRYTKVEFANRFEYGVQQDLTIGADIRFAAVQSTSFINANTQLTGWNFGISDPRLYARQRLHQTQSGEAAWFSVL
jgi:hypothetical protein